MRSESSRAGGSVTSLRQPRRGGASGARSARHARAHPARPRRRSSSATASPTPTSTRSRAAPRSARAPSTATSRARRSSTWRCWRSAAPCSTTPCAPPPSRATPSLERLRSIGRFYRRYWSEHPEYFFIFSVLHFQEFIGQLSPALLAEVRGIWERPLRRLEQVIADGVRRGELRRCDPWVMANVIWRTGQQRRRRAGDARAARA